MDKKLKFVMVEQNLTVGKVAAMLGVNSAVVSHILANRNKPSYQLTAKIVETFPKYNPYWWLGISETIYNSNNSTTSVAETQSEQSGLNIEKGTGANFSKPTTSSNDTDDSLNSAQRLVQNFSVTATSIERVIVVYADKTFESFTVKR